MRMTLVLLGLAGLSACAPQVPDSAQGIGFDSFEQQQAARDAALARPTYLPDTVVPPGQTAPFPGAVAPVPGSAEATALETRQVLDATRPTYQGQTLGSTINPSQPNTATAGGVAIGNAAISDENNFDAVTARQTIESDAARIEQNRAQYQVIPPQDLPTRDGSSDPNIVAFALQTQHPLGQQIYPRGSFSNQGRFERNCASYASNDLAQIDFLARGGPENDRRGLDPDGDGFACAWDPTPFRRANGG